MMRRNIHFNILLLLLLVEAISVHAVAQIPDRTLYQSISLDEYLKRVGDIAGMRKTDIRTKSTGTARKGEA